MLRILLGVLVGLCLIAGAALVQAQTQTSLHASTAAPGREMPKTAAAK